MHGRTGVVVQDNAAQQWCYSTMLASNTISNTVKFAKMIHPDFFGEDGGKKEVIITLTSILLDYDEDTGDQNSKPSIDIYQSHNTNLRPTKRKTKIKPSSLDR